MPPTGEEEVFTTYTTEMPEAKASVVCLCGELDASTAPSFLADMHKVLTRKQHVVMDVHLLSYADSTGVAAILSVRNAIREAGMRMCLVGCHGLLSKILSVLDLHKELVCYEDIEDALTDIATAQKC